MNQTNLQILQSEEDLSRQAQTGVSLHCHTLHSKEMLDFIPFYSEKIPIVSHFFKKECRRFFEREGKLPDFSKGFWSPPLTGEQVFKSEKEQLGDVGLGAVVSITDHDTIEANLQLNKLIPNPQAPISMEWTVPFEDAFFHIGVHNLPPERAVEIKSRLLEYTFQKEFQNNQNLHEIFAMLDEISEVLIVLNHPVWDIEMIGQERHLHQLKIFIADYGKWIHALEINGFRSWSENKAVIEMAETLDFPLVSGGDRHCFRRNTMINLTDSDSFAGFVEEIRTDRHSRIVLMPEYRQPLAFRQVRSMAHILTDYPEFPEGRQKWLERVFLDFGNGEGLRPMSHHWQGGTPKWLRRAMRTLRVVSHQKMLPLFRLAEARQNFVPNQSKTPKTTHTIKHNPLVAKG